MTAKDSEAVREAVEAARKRLPVAGDAQFLSLKKAEVGSPALVSTPEGEPVFWIVPLLVKSSACGFARVELSRKISQMGMFGSGPEDQLSWIDASFFENPPPEILAAIRTQYPESDMSEPVLSFDASPSKWAWRIEIRKDDKIESIAFITPHGWYERQSNREITDLEG